jgi:hypothetical protein
LKDKGIKDFEKESGVHQSKTMRIRLERLRPAHRALLSSKENGKLSAGGGTPGLGN